MNRFLLACVSTALVGGLLLVPSGARAEAPGLFPVQGVVSTARGTALSGPHQVGFSLWTDAEGGVELWSDTSTIEFDGGFFSTYLGGADDPVDMSWFAEHDGVYLHMAVDGDTGLDRIRVGTSPYAGFAQYCGDATTVGGMPATDLLYTAGEGLHLDQGEFSVSRDDVEAWVRATAFDTAAEVQEALGGAYMASGYTPDWSELTNIPEDIADGDADTTYAAGDGLAVAEGVFRLATEGCEAGYVLRRNEANDGWACVEMDFEALANLPDMSVYATEADLAPVAKTGAYADLSGTPDMSVYSETSSLASVATSGSYSDLSDAPNLSSVATSGAYGDLSGTPDLSVYAETSSLASVATSGAYGDLSGAPDLSVYATSSGLSSVATSGAYADLSGAPDLGVYATSSSLASVATSGSYADLSGTPALSSVATSGAYADLSGTPALSSVATSGAYADLSGAPDLSVYAKDADLAPVATTGSYVDLSNKPALAPVAISGSYNDLTDKPSSSGGGGASAYGDGSAGSLTISGSVNWYTSPPSNNNFQFVDLTIQAGATLVVASGTVIRCSGTFTNNGTLVVHAGVAISEGHEGAKGLARTSPYGSYTNSWGGQVVGKAIAAGQAAILLDLPVEAGGSGGWGWNTSGGAGDGGGSLVLRAAAGVVNAGTIRANGGAGQSQSGATGNGGGAGGFLVIASKGDVTNSGVIQANGGPGANPSGVNNGGAGGGGGGGIIHVLAPNASTLGGAVQVAGGAPGTNAGDGTGTWGAPGGGLGGDGGFAGDGTGNPATAGDTGHIFRSEVADPGGMFL